MHFLLKKSKTENTFLITSMQISTFCTFVTKIKPAIWAFSKTLAMRLSSIDSVKDAFFWT